MPMDKKSEQRSTTSSSRCILTGASKWMRASLQSSTAYTKGKISGIMICDAHGGKAAASLLLAAYTAAHLAKPFFCQHGTRYRLTATMKSSAQCQRQPMSTAMQPLAYMSSMAACHNECNPGMPSGIGKLPATDEKNCLHKAGFELHRTYITHQHTKQQCPLACQHVAFTV